MYFFYLTHTMHNLHGGSCRSEMGFSKILPDRSIYLESLYEPYGREWMNKRNRKIGGGIRIANLSNRTRIVRGHSRSDVFIKNRLKRHSDGLVLSTFIYCGTLIIL